jgi:hypothetical protein
LADAHQAGQVRTVRIIPLTNMRRGCKGEVVLNTSGRGDTGALNKQYNQEVSEEVLEVAYPLKEHLVAGGNSRTATQCA